MKHENPLVQALLDTQDDPFVLIDGNYRIVAANQAYADAYDVSRATVVGRSCHEVSHHSARPCHENGECCPLRQVFSTGEPCDIVHVHFDRGNRAERVRLKGYPIRGADGAVYLGERIFRLDDRPEHRSGATMVGSSPSFLAALGTLAASARTEAPVLLAGESGVGKELAARFLHDRSARKSQPWIAVDCATISQPLFESELFGHERGAFTGCAGRKKGLFELAEGGTLFLDEVGDIPLPMQAKLLRVLETGEFRRVGGNQVLKGNVRLVAASNHNLGELVAGGLFRQDLFYRISVIEITLPPLRERRSDIRLLAEVLIERGSAGEPNRPRLTPAALEKLAAYDYPGNVRELRNIILNAMLKGDNTIDADDIVFRGGSRHRCAVPLGAMPSRPQSCDHDAMPGDLAALLASHNGHRAAAAKSLGVSERTLYRRLRRLRAQDA